MSIFAACCLCWTLIAETPHEQVTYTVDSRRFMVPIRIAHKVDQEKINRLILYSSSDKGQTWHEFAKIAPDEKRFMFSAPRDGIYWFMVQMILKDNTKVPSLIGDAEPMLRVGVDTGSKKTRQTAQDVNLEREIKCLRAKVEKLENRIAELEKQQKTKP